MKQFKYALNGIIHVFKKEQNFKIHVIATGLVIFAGIIFSIDKTDFLMIVIAISIVLSFELINSAIEYLCNFVSPDYHDKIKIIKDTSAGAVLTAATGALILALVIFVPKIIELIK